MTNFKYFQDQLKNLNQGDFDSFAMELFHFQAVNNPVYANYLKFLKIDHLVINSIIEIPFLPISFFKKLEVKSGDWEPEVTFESSGTTSKTRSRHYLNDLNYYHQHAERLFQNEFGNLSGHITLALLPSYLERANSSLVSMVSYFIDKSKSGSGFYLDNFYDLKSIIEANQGQKIILWGVTFALLEFAQFGTNLDGCTVIETGGMKGRGPELVRQDLYDRLRSAFSIKNIYSEYGMTELLSQSYATNGSFRNSLSMKILLRDVNDPFSYVLQGKTGGVNVIDLANIHSCAFIETQDLGRYTSETNFEIVGRFDNSDVRGCNLLLIE